MWKYRRAIPSIKDKLIEHRKYIKADTKICPISAGLKRRQR